MVFSEVPAYPLSVRKGEELIDESFHPDVDCYLGVLG